ncbi:hypothetical protein LCGC14_0262470 [marine sediment metagenome]|uniref:Uncharacterized protein n=1 Tax=marine sediment metagenome TaxID=412755 RepID=A0A0F9X5X2_9ZZZZ
MAGKVRYRVYGIVDEEAEDVGSLLEEMRQYGSAYLVETEVVENASKLPDAEDDFQERYEKK